jgi:hypothetical protein
MTGATSRTKTIEIEGVTSADVVRLANASAEATQR